MRRGQSTLEYVYVIGIAAVALIAVLAYMSRGFQGSLRNQSEQLGAGSYDPKNINVNNTETKHTVGSVVSTGSSTTTYGASGDTTISNSANTDRQTVTVDKTTNEGLGDLSSDTWR